jgi:hypothetical protein
MFPDLSELTMKRFILLLQICISGLALGQTSEWKWQNPLPQGNELMDVQCVNNQFTYAVGKFGTPYPIPPHTDITFVVKYDS